MHAVDHDIADGFWLAATIHGGGPRPGSSHEPTPVIEALDSALRARVEAARPPAERSDKLRWVRAVGERIKTEGMPPGPVDLDRVAALPLVARALLAGDVPADLGQRLVQEAPPLRDGSRDPRLRRLVLAHVTRPDAPHAGAVTPKERDE